jgi:dienelactone hydrolase
MGGGVLGGWTPGSFTHEGVTRPTFRRGTGPGVVVVHELPGITPEVTRFANDVVDAGFTVVMPSLTGEPGRAPSFGYGLAAMVKVCIAKEFTTWALRQTSPIITWLRALAAELHGELGGPGVGAVGMCFSGGFALAMMVDDVIQAPVCSQPSLPFAFGRARKIDLNLDPSDLDIVKRRAAAGCPVLALQFHADFAVGERLAVMQAELGDAVTAVRIPSRKRADHSVLTEQRDEPSVQRVLAFLRERLAAPRQ